MPKIFIVILFLAMAAIGQTASPGFDLANYGVRIDADRRLIIVLATLEMARTRDLSGNYIKLINTPLSERGARFRERLLADNADLSEDLRQKISSFVLQYKKRRPQLDDAAIIAPFVSMAYTLSPAPDLADPVITSDLPGNLLDVLDFAPLVREFYRRSGIGGRLEDYVKDYRLAADGVLRDSTRDMISELLSYLHTRPELFFTERVKVKTQGKTKKETIEKIETRIHERHFYIVPEMLAPRDNVNFLNIKDDYFVILPPDKDLSFSDVRRAYLQFVIDPLVLKNSREFDTIGRWAKPILEDLAKKDPSISSNIFLMVTRSLVVAIDSRQTEFNRLRIATNQARQKLPLLKTDEEKKAVTDDLKKFERELADEAIEQLYEDYTKGALLSFYFADQLKGVEDSGFDIDGSMREMIASFDPGKEPDRVAGTSAARIRALAAREQRKSHPETRTIVAENPVTTRLFEIQKAIDAKNYTAAAADLKKLLAAHPGDPRIYYNIGRVASLIAAGISDPDAVAQKLQEAKTAYSNVLNTATPTTDKALLSLTYFALGRIYEFFNSSDYALKLYDLAIKLDDVAGGAFRDAIAAKQRLLKPQ